VRAHLRYLRASGVARGYQHGEASKSETTTKGAHIAILDSIVIKRGATAAAEQTDAGASSSSSSSSSLSSFYGVYAKANERWNLTARYFHYFVIILFSSHAKLKIL